MKTVITSITLLILASIAHAGNPPMTTCSNHQGTIEISQRGVSILTNKNPTAEYTKLSYNEINLAQQVIQQMPEEKRGCTTRTVVFKQIEITKKDGSKMPDAYNRLAQSGSLNDYFICATSHAWLPGDGQTCN